MKYGVGKFEGVYKRAKEIVIVNINYSKIRMMTKYQLRHSNLQ